MTVGEKKIFLFRKEVLISLLVLFFLSAYILQENIFTSSTSNISAREYFWQQKIVMAGASAAYEELSVSLEDKNPSIQHNEAHAFGEALFNVAGLDGISTCDTNFGYGCFHQFIGTAIHILGIDSITILNKECVKTQQVTGCQHGIGHGLISYLGYDEKSLLRAISMCDTLQRNSYINGCTGGLFMEYNLRTMLGDGSVVRPLEEGGWHSECSKYSGVSQKSCTYYLGQWWWVLLSNIEPEKKFATMGGWCSNVPNEELRRVCFEGVGQIVAAGGKYEPSRSIELCSAVSIESDKQLYCRSYGANTFLGTGFPEKAKEMCNGLSEVAQVYCTAYATGEASLAHELPPPQLLQ